MAHKIVIISLNLTLQRYGSNRGAALKNHPNVNFGDPTKIYPYQGSCESLLKNNTLHQ